MSDFILEIYGEEIPSSAQSLIENQFEKLFSQLLEDNEIKYKDLLTFSKKSRSFWTSQCRDCASQFSSNFKNT